MIDVYDYLTWRANVRGYLTIDGLSARTSPEMINDILKRSYLTAMMDESLAAGFSEWRRQETSQADEGSVPQDAPQVAKSTGALPTATGDVSRLERFLRTHSPVSRGTRLKLWQAQLGRCSICRREKPLRVMRKRVDVQNHLTEGDVPFYVAVCVACRIKHASELDAIETSHLRKRSGELN
jgi:hypothetical protein